MTATGAEGLFDGGGVEAYLHEHIPISERMGIAVRRADLDAVVLSAPLGPNINHRSTVFGGSCASVAILAAWTLVHLRVRAAAIPSRVVITRSEMDYLLPIGAEFVATCQAPPPEQWELFLRTLRRRGQARIGLSASVASDGREVATYQGTYAAITTESGSLPAPRS